MKKKLMSVMLVIALAISTFGGCDLISTDTERDMAQVVATVTTGENYSDDILKRDLVALFNSTGYYYVQNYGKTYAETYELLITSLIERKITLQEAKRYYTTSVNPQGLTDIEKYLEKWEIEKSRYDVKVSVNELLDSFEKSIIENLAANDEDTDTVDETYLKWEGYKETLRTVPTSADAEDEEEIADEDYLTDKYTKYSINLSSISEVKGSTAETRKKAYKKMVTAIKYYNLLGDTVFTNFEGSDFFKDEFKSQMEQALLTKYIDYIKDQVTLDTDKATENPAITLYYNDILQTYQDIYDKQKEDYTASVSDYKTALEALTKDTYLLYNPYENYGFVYNILIPFDTAQTYAYNLMKKLTYVENDGGLSSADQLRIKRKSLLKDVTGSDLRASWITNGYNFDLDTLLFEDKMYTDTDLYKGYPFNGTVVDNGTVTKDGDTVYKINSKKQNITEIVENEFMGLFGTDVTLLKDNTTNFYTEKDPTKDDFYYLYTGKVNNNSEETLAKVNDFMFAYSTDTGCLNKYLGYAYPNSSEFVAEFSRACEYVIGQGEGSFAVVATDYGWHIVYCTKTVQKTSDGEFVNEYTLNQDEFGVEDTFTQKFADEFLTTMQTKYYNQKKAELTTKFNISDYVKTYANKYKDLILD
jgi:hypothetical protein